MKISVALLSSIGDTMLDMQPTEKAMPSSARIVFDLPISTSTNDLYTRGKGGRVRLSDEYRAWKLQAGNEILVQRPKWPVKALPPRQTYAITITVADIDPGDIDNRIKSLLDLLKDMRITPDDRWLWDERILRRAGVPVGTMRIAVRSVDVAAEETAIADARAIASAPWCYSSEAITEAMNLLLERAA